MCFPTDSEIVATQSTLKRVPPGKTVEGRARDTESDEWMDATAMRMGNGWLLGFPRDAHDPEVIVTTQELIDRVPTLFTMTSASADAARAAKRDTISKKRKAEFDEAEARSQARAQFEANEEEARIAAGVSPGSFVKLKKQIVAPSPLEINNHKIYKDPSLGGTSRDVVIRQVVLDGLGRDLRQSLEHTKKRDAAAASAKEDKRGWCNVPDTRRAVDCGGEALLGQVARMRTAGSVARETAQRKLTEAVPALLRQINRTSDASKLGVQKLIKLLTFYEAKPDGLKAKAGTEEPELSVVLLLPCCVAVPCWFLPCYVMTHTGNRGIAHAALGETEIRDTWRTS